MGNVTEDKTQTKKYRYRVIIMGIEDEFETKESFALKLSLLCRVPVTKIKHIIRQLPAKVWEGEEERNAKALLSMINESGGKGELLEIEVEEERDNVDEGSSDKNNSGERICPKCGSGVGKDQDYCDFCYSPLNSDNIKSKERSDIIRVTRNSIPRGRMIFYIVVVILLILIAIISNI